MSLTPDPAACALEGSNLFFFLSPFSCAALARISSLGGNAVYSSVHCTLYRSSPLLLPLPPLPTLSTPGFEKQAANRSSAYSTCHYHWNPVVLHPKVDLAAGPLTILTTAIAIFTSPVPPPPPRQHPDDRSLSRVGRIWRLALGWFTSRQPNHSLNPSPAPPERNE